MANDAQEADNLNDDNINNNDVISNIGAIVSNIDDNKCDTSFNVGTWNIHDWLDKDRNPNINRIITALSKTPMDFIGFQEATYKALKEKNNNNKNKYYKDVLKILRNKLCFKMTSDQTMNKKFYSGVIMASKKYKIIQTITHLNDSIQLNIIQLSDNNNIGIIVMHLNHKNEQTRINQYNDMLKMIHDNNYTNLPLILLGDFNALTRTDYSDDQWNNIENIRKQNKWELPCSELIQKIKQSNMFLDCYDICNKKYKNNINDLATCKYNTRIDYIFVNKQLLKEFSVSDFQHLTHGNCSDHKMVSIKLKSKQ